MKDDQVITLVSDIANFNLGIFGTAITLFTVLYAFILSKKDSLIQLNDYIKNGDSTPNIIQKVSFYYNHLKKWKKINKHLKIIIITSLISFLSGNLIKYLPTTKYTILVGVFFISLSIILLIYIIVILAFVFINYDESTKIS